MFFYYDADGKRVRKDDPNGTTAYAGAHFEKNAYTGVQRATYSFNGQVVAVRNGATTTWLHSDHLGSASLATDVTGVPVAGSETRYTPWGEVRVGGTLPTDGGFTSQRREDNIRLNDYVARMYDPFIGKFIQPDSVVPGAGNPQAFNRYAGMLNNPMAFVDPSGHEPCDVYAGSQCVSRYFDPSADTAGNVGGIVAQQVVAQAGAEFTNGDATWAWHEQWWVAQGVMALASKMGGYAQLRTLLGGIATEFRRVHNLGYQVAGEAYGAIFAGRNLIKFADWGFRQLSEGIANDKSATEIEQYRILGVSGAAVHELFHIIDYRNPGFRGQLRKDTPLTDYANEKCRFLDVVCYIRDTPSGEYWAEAGRLWVYPESTLTRIWILEIDQIQTLDQLLLK